MKILNVWMLSLLMVMFSCGKDDAVIEPAMMNAKVDGTTVDCDVVNGTMGSGTLQINGRNSTTNNLFSLSVNNYTEGQTGTFNIGSGNFNTAAYREGNKAYSAGTSAGNGKIIITKSSSKAVKGSFEFTGVSLDGLSKQITEGRFHVLF